MSIDSTLARRTITNGSALAELLPEYGGLLNRLCLDAGQGPVDVIAGIRDAQTMIDNRQYRGVHLFPFPNRLNNGRYEFAGKEYRFPINESELNNALHGFLYQRNPDRLFLPSANQLDWMFVGDGTDNYFPFPCCVIVQYRLHSAAELSVRFSVLNTGNTAMPFGIGWHPYFILEESIDDLALQLPRVRRVLVNERMLPTGRKQNFDAFAALRRLGDQRFDTCFEIQQHDHIARTRLWSEKRQIGLDIWQDSGEHGCRFLQICTAPDRKSIAIEPMSCSIDAFNSGDGLRVLDPGEFFSTRFGVKLIAAK